MKHSQKITFLSITCILLIVLSACNNELQDYHEDSDMNISTQEYPNEITDNQSSSQSHSGAVVDTNVEIAPHIDLNTITTHSAEIVKLDYDLLKQLLFLDKEIIEEGSAEMAEPRTDAPYRYCIASDGFSLSYTGEGFTYTNDNYALMQRILNSGDVDLDQFRDIEDLNFSSRIAAQHDIQNILNQLGIGVSDTPVCYTLDFVSLQAICDQLNASRKKDAGDNLSLYTPLVCDEADACYIFIYQVTTEGLPISTQSNGIFGDGSWTSGTSLCCIYSAQGIVGMELPYTFKVTEQEAQAFKGLNANQALERLDNKLNSMILSGLYQVNRLEFEYVPMPINGSRNLFELIPAWRISVIHTYQYQDNKNPGKTNSAKEEFQVVYNAITGEEIISSLGGV